MGWPGEKQRHSMSARGVSTRKYRTKYLSKQDAQRRNKLHDELISKGFDMEIEKSKYKAQGREITILVRLTDKQKIDKEIIVIRNSMINIIQNHFDDYVPFVLAELKEQEQYGSIHVREEIKKYKKITKQEIIQSLQDSLYLPYFEEFVKNKGLKVAGLSYYDSRHPRGLTHQKEILDIIRKYHPNAESSGSRGYGLLYKFYEKSIVPSTGGI